MTTRTTADLNT